MTQFGYDANSNLLTVTDAKSQQTVYTPNNMNRTTSRKDPLLNTETYTYDNNGNLATVLNRKSQTTTYTYDPLNRRTKTTFHDGTSTNYTYDAGNRITQVQEKDAGNVVTATITRAYDGLDRLTQEVTPHGTVNYTYDNASRRATMTVVGQPQVVYTYDNANRLTNIQQGTSNVVIGYDDADRRTSVTYPNTNSITYGYNNASELISITYKQGATTLGTLTYTYDAAGNRIKTGGTFARSNIPPALTTTNYNANNQQLTFGTTTETYDLNGNLATSTDAGVTTTYTWNTRNQLTGISRTGLTASFAYDSFGRRTGKTINGTTTNFVYDGLNPVQEKNGATVTANLLTGLGIDEFFTRTDSVGVRSLLPDALGSTVALGDGTGTLQIQYTYEPFGFVSQTGAASTNSYKFTGREDDGSGLMYYRTRYYQPRFQRFISEDPIEYLSGDTNLYTYVFNDPISFSDPSGLMSRAQCDELRNTIIRKTGYLLHDLFRYDPVADGRGGHTTHGGKLTKPGGHHNEIKERQWGLIRDISRYIKKCTTNCDDGPAPPSLPEWVEEAATRPIPDVVYPAVPQGPAIMGPTDPIRIPQIPAGARAPIFSRPLVFGW